METHIEVFYADPFSLLILHKGGQLLRLYTPFRVQIREPVETFPAGAWVYVNAVWPDKEERLLYHIGNRFFPYRFFRIQIAF